MMNNINLKYFIIGVISLAILIVIGSLIIKSIWLNKAPVNQKLTQQSTSSATPAVSVPTVTSLSAEIKEVKKDVLIVTLLDSQQSLEIPINENVSFEAWINDKGPNEPPTRQTVSPANLKPDQIVDIFKTEAANQPTLYEITILNYSN